MDPRKWMGAVRIRVQKADKHHNNPQVMTRVQHLTQCEVKNCLFARKKQVEVKGILMMDYYKNSFSLHKRD